MITIPVDWGQIPAASVPYRAYCFNIALWGLLFFGQKVLGKKTKKGLSATDRPLPSGCSAIKIGY